MALTFVPRRRSRHAQLLLLLVLQSTQCGYGSEDAGKIAAGMDGAEGAAKEQDIKGSSKAQQDECAFIVVQGAPELEELHLCNGVFARRSESVYVSTGEGELRLWYHYDHPRNGYMKFCEFDRVFRDSVIYL